MVQICLWKKTLACPLIRRKTKSLKHNKRVITMNINPNQSARRLRRPALAPQRKDNRELATPAHSLEQHELHAWVCFAMRLWRLYHAQPNYSWHAYERWWLWLWDVTKHNVCTHKASKHITQNAFIVSTYACVCAMTCWTIRLLTSSENNFCVLKTVLDHRLYTILRTISAIGYQTTDRMQ